MKVVLSTAYWPNLLYFSQLLNAEEVIIEQHEHYPKQSYRNRTEILSANGVLPLSIPVMHGSSKQETKDVLINYSERWQIRHWRAITSAYRNSTYFEFFEDEIRRFYFERFDQLLEYNLQQLLLIRKILKTNIIWNLSSKYLPEYSLHKDLREQIHPKLKPELALNLLKPYYQTFGDKFGFVQNLSILDILFNTGLESLNYLRLERKNNRP